VSPSKRPTSLFLPPSISSTLPKQVRILLISLDDILLTFVPLLLVRSGAVTAILINPLWVVKVQTFTAPPNSPAADRLLEYMSTFNTVSSSINLNAPGGLRAIYRDEGWHGLYHGTMLALQFIVYEKMKTWAFERKRWQFAKLGREWTVQDDKPVRCAFLTHNVN